MGINANAGIKYLLEIADGYNYYFGKSLLMLGKLDVNMTYNEFTYICNKRHFNYLEQDYNEGKIDSVTMFKMMGFSLVHSLDVSDYEGAEIIFDLNNRDLPQSLINAYDYIYDGGTLEHVFDIAGALISTSKMLKEGGIIIHDLPAHNWLDHGFYCISPTLLIDYYNVNRFSIMTSYMLGKMPGKEDIISADCRYNNNEKFITDYINDEKVIVICIAKKTMFSSESKIPTQGFYYVLERNRAYGKIDKDVIIKKLILWLNKLEDRSVALYGLGDTTASILQVCRDNKQYNTYNKIVGVYSRDKKMKGEYDGVPILNIDNIVDNGIKNVVIGSLSKNTEEIYTRLSYLHEKDINLVKLCDFM